MHREVAEWYFILLRCLKDRVRIAPRAERAEPLGASRYLSVPLGSSRFLSVPFGSDLVNAAVGTAVVVFFCLRHGSTALRPRGVLPRFMQCWASSGKQGCRQGWGACTAPHSALTSSSSWPPARRSASSARRFPPRSGSGGGPRPPAPWAEGTCVEPDIGKKNPHTVGVFSVSVYRDPVRSRRESRYYYQVEKAPREDAKSAREVRLRRAHTPAPRGRSLVR